MGDTLQNFVLIGSSDLVPQDAFSQRFLYSINISGFLCIAFLVYTLVRPYIVKAGVEDEDLEWAKTILERHGSTALNHFKTYFDKIIFRPGGHHHEDNYVELTAKIYENVNVVRASSPSTN